MLCIFDEFFRKNKYIRYAPNLSFMYNQFEAAAMLYAKYNIVCHKQILIMT